MFVQVWPTAEVATVVRRKLGRHSLAVATETAVTEIWKVGRNLRFSKRR
jgi:hypothetical protein